MILVSMKQKENKIFKTIYVKLLTVREGVINTGTETHNKLPLEMRRTAFECLRMNFFITERFLLSTNFFFSNKNRLYFLIQINSLD
jgi:hypothetical protein